jgi:hypothetical protein
MTAAAAAGAASKHRCASRRTPSAGSLLALPAGTFRAAAGAPVALTTYLFARGEW